MSDLAPASKAKGPTYDPQSMTMSHDSVFSQVAPGLVSSGSLAHKWGSPEDHTRLSAPPDKLSGD